MPVTTRGRTSCCGSGRHGDRLVKEKPVRSHRFNNNSPVESTSLASAAAPLQKPILSASSGATEFST